MILFIWKPGMPRLNYWIEQDYSSAKPDEFMSQADSIRLLVYSFWRVISFKNVFSLLPPDTELYLLLLECLVTLKIGFVFYWFLRFGLYTLSGLSWASWSILTNLPSNLNLFSAKFFLHSYLTNFWLFLRFFLSQYFLTLSPLSSFESPRG